MTKTKSPQKQALDFTGGALLAIIIGGFIIDILPTFAYILIGIGGLLMFVGGIWMIVASHGSLLLIFGGIFIITGVLSIVGIILGAIYEVKHEGMSTANKILLTILGIIVVLFIIMMIVVLTML